MAAKEKTGQKESGIPLEAHFVTYDPERPHYELVCICQYLSDLDKFFGIGENNRPEADQNK